jgi:hypothetical protein
MEGRSSAAARRKKKTINSNLRFRNPLHTARDSSRGKRARRCFQVRVFASQIRALAIKCKVAAGAKEDEATTAEAIAIRASRMKKESEWVFSRGIGSGCRWGGRRGEGGSRREKEGDAGIL